MVVVAYSILVSAPIQLGLIGLRTGTCSGFGLGGLGTKGLGPILTIMLQETCFAVVVFVDSRRHSIFRKLEEKKPKT